MLNHVPAIEAKQTHRTHFEGHILDLYITYNNHMYDTVAWDFFSEVKK